MIKRILIANRGEIAARIIRSCKRLGITTVAVYSDADRNAPYIAQADHACLIGPPEAASSYLDANKLIDAAKQFQAEAIHPGYGFLSENAEFADLCAKNGLIFIGPSPQTIRSMGSKIEAKGLAAEAGVPMIPGYFGSDQSDTALARASEEVGVPLLIKASAGGGGRGMRLVEDLADFNEALTLARAESQAAFGDNRVLLERYIGEPRHIEVQLLGDQHGNLVHLFERECSIQRNYQKVIEEAPAAHLPEQTRQCLFEYALRLGNAMHYDSTGTVEFILDNKSGEVFFLEMNTRLQVEHPVTEAVTGLDLVALQIQVASGELLPVSQQQITLSGWAIEARVNAEDPAQGYQPQTGVLEVYTEPSNEGIRVDSGVVQGSIITPYYDSMIAKIIAHGPDRSTATQRLSAALLDLSLVGVGTNAPFLRDILEHANFSGQPLTTQFIDRAFPQGWQPHLPDIQVTPVAAAAAWLLKLEGWCSKAKSPDTATSPWQSLGPWRLIRRAGHEEKTSLVLEQSDGSTTTVEMHGVGGRYITESGADKLPVQAAVLDGGDLAVEIDGRYRRYQVHFDEQTIYLSHDGHGYKYRILTPQEIYLRDEDEAASGGSSVFAPMPGLVAEVNVSSEDRVAAGDIVIVLESMKLLQNLTAPRDGVVKSVRCEAGNTVDSGALLVEIEENTGDT